MDKPEHNKIVTVPEPGKFEIVNRPSPHAKPGSVLVKMEIAAVCVDDRMYTDHTHEWFDHPLYGVGHEGVGTVVEAPDSHVFKPGDKVLISHDGYCGRCFACQNSLSQKKAKKRGQVVSFASPSQHCRFQNNISLKIAKNHVSCGFQR